MMKINKAKLLNLCSLGYVISQKHPIHDLHIYNYSQKTQYNKRWNDVTLMCRGLVLDADYNIVARGFDKFFNLEELRTPEIPNEKYEVFEKYDGSYICVFKYKGDLIVASRGSFTSEHALFANTLIDDKYPDIKLIADSDCFVFELIADWNRIVCDYKGQNKLVLTGGRKDGKEYDYDQLIGWSEVFKCDVAERYTGYEYESLKGLIKKNHEGFVVRFENGYRMKIKGEEYIKLHRLVTNITPKRIAEAYQDAVTWEKFVEHLPDEFMEEVNEVVEKLEIEFNALLKSCDSVYNYLNSTYDISDRKLFAERAKDYGNLAKLLFLRYDKKYDQLREIVWKIVCKDL